MKLIYMSLAVTTILLMEGRVLTAQRLAGSDGGSGASAEAWKLVWADEFNEEGRPDSRNWNYETGFVRNRELQWYQPDNVRCEKGLLIIEARRERKPNPNHDPNGRQNTGLGKTAFSRAVGEASRSH